MLSFNFKFMCSTNVVMEMITTTDPAFPANLLTTIRAVTNLFKNSCYYGWLQKHH